MKRKLMLLMTCLFIGIGLVNAQISKVTGTVISEEDGLPVVGASIVVKGTTLGTVTDMDGKFTLTNLPSSAETLMISFIGMHTQEVKIQPTLSVVLKADTEVLDEVMVVAYGTAKKSQFTGSAATIGGEKIAQRQVSNVSNALSGQVAGVQTTSSNGQPGTGSTVRIRGIGSMSASNNPLYVVDGVPFDGDIATINPQDIASMTVLKDAASNALYGARGANGVILITTRRGEQGKATVSVDAKWGTNRRAVPNYDVITDPGQYMEIGYASIKGSYPTMANDRLNANLTKLMAYNPFNVPEGQQLIGEDGKINPNATIGRVYENDYWLQPDDWYNELFDNGNLRQEYNINISGASDKMNYYLSAGYLDDSGIIAGSGFTRFSARLKADYQVNKFFKVGGNVAYSNTVSDYPGDQSGSSSANIFYVANMIAPIYPLYVRNADGSIKTDSRGFTVYDYGAGEYPGLGRPFMGNSSPASQLQLDSRDYTADVISAKGFAEIRIFDGLKATANWGVDVDNTRARELVNAFYGQYSEVGGIASVSHAREFSTNQQYLLSYIKQFGIHNIDLLAGFEKYDYTYQYLSGSKQNLYNPLIPEISNAINEPSVSSYTNKYSAQGFLARAQYNYDEKYFASLSFRRDASSRFHPDNRWGNFWSAGASWLINKESFMSDVDWVDMLKFKISYGIQGNDNLGNYYPYQDQYSVVNSNNDFAISLDYKGNKDITWETSHSFNTGIEFDLFGGRLSGGFEYFSRKTTDMLYYRPVPNSLGYSSYPMNVGSMINKGIELDLHGTIIKTKDIEWGMNFNLTHFKNEIIELHPDLNGEWISGSYIYREGESSYQFYMREWAGVDQETGEAMWYKDIKDQNGNVTGRETTKTYADATRYGTGDILPKVYGGFGTTFNAYGFDLSLSFAYQLGGKIYDNTYAALMHTDGGDFGTNWHKDILNSWSETNKNSNIPRNAYNDVYSSSMSTRFITSSDYLSLQNISLGYTLPKKLTQKMQINNLRLYVTADNVALWSARKGLDPRQGYSASGNDVYSPIRSISGGISFQF